MSNKPSISICLRLFVLLFMLTSLSACVTVSEDNRRKVDPKKQAETLIDLGMKYVEVDKRDLARQRFVKALKHDKGASRAYHGIALVHQLNTENELAEVNFKKALSLSKTQQLKSAVYKDYGLFLMENENYKQACEQFEKAGKDLDYRGRAEAIYLAGSCALKTGNNKRAKSAFSHAINLNARIVQPHIELADLFFKEQNYTQAKKHLDQFANLSKHNARSLWLGIQIERIFGNRDKESSYALQLKNLHGYSNEYLKYKNSL